MPVYNVVPSLHFFSIKSPTAPSSALTIKPATSQSCVRPTVRLLRISRRRRLARVGLVPPLGKCSKAHNCLQSRLEGQTALAAGGVLTSGPWRETILDLVACPILRPILATWESATIRIISSIDRDFRLLSPTRFAGAAGQEDCKDAR